MTRRKRGRKTKMDAPEQSTPEGSKPEVIIPEGGALMTNGLMTTLKSLPEDMIHELIGKYEECAVQIRRRNNRGQLASLGYSGVSLSPSDLLTVDSYISARMGGGTYLIDVRDRRDTRVRLLPPFEIVVEGPPRMPIPPHMPVTSSPGGVAPQVPQAPSFGSIPAGFDPSRQNPEVRNPMTGSWSQGLDPATRAFYEQSARAQAAMLPPGASVPSDQLAMDRAARAEARVSELEAKLEAMLTRTSEKERYYQDQLRAEQEKAREERHKMEMALLQEQIRAASSSKPVTTGMQDMVPLLTALAPVMTALVQSGKEQQTAMMTSQQQAMQQFLSLVAEQSKKPQVDPLTVIEKLAPVLGMGKQDPNAQAALFEAMSNAQLQQVAMLAQMVEAQNQASGGQSPYGPLMETIVAGLGQMVQGYMADKQRAAMEAAMRQRALGAGPQQQRPQQAPQQPQQAPQPPLATDGPSTVIYSTVPTSDTPVLPSGKLKVTPEMLDMLPAEYRSDEWKKIIVSLHDEMNPNKLGTLIARYIGHLDEFDLLPQALKDYHVNPGESLSKLLMPLPIYASNPNYATTVVEATVKAMFEQGVLEVDDGSTPEENDENDDAEAEDNVVPFPTQS